ncbi:MAG: response regulator [Terracidiphilus sp.]|jgi:CheY-like chemotaxis protein
MSTILLVDSDPLQGFLRKAILERRFRDVQRVRDAAEALCLVEQPKFAGNLGLVISDTSIPGIGSLAFVAELRERLPNVPVLVLGERDAAPDFSGGWVRFLSRPFVGEQILDAASDLMERHSCEAA